MEWGEDRQANGLAGGLFAPGVAARPVPFRVLYRSLCLSALLRPVCFASFRSAVPALCTTPLGRLHTDQRTT